MSLKILYVEDTLEKYMDVAMALKSTGVKLVRMRNLKGAVGAIEAEEKKGEPFDLILTDMEYPLGGMEAPKSDAGELLVEEVRKRSRQIPVIIISSVNLTGAVLEGVYGVIWYRQNHNGWERELSEMIRKVNMEIK